MTLSPPTAAPPVRASGVVKRWGRTTALDGASLTVGHGVTGLLGANGSGKTTLLGMLLGLHEPDRGSVQVLGLDPATAGPQVRARVGYSPERRALRGLFATTRSYSQRGTSRRARPTQPICQGPT